MYRIISGLGWDRNEKNTQGESEHGVYSLYMRSTLPLQPTAKAGGEVLIISTQPKISSLPFVSGDVIVLNGSRGTVEKITPQIMTSPTQETPLPTMI